MNSFSFFRSSHSHFVRNTFSFAAIVFWSLVEPIYRQFIPHFCPCLVLSVSIQYSLETHSIQIDLGEFMRNCCSPANNMANIPQCYRLRFGMSHSLERSGHPHAFVCSWLFENSRDSFEIQSITISVMMIAATEEPLIFNIFPKA